MSKWIYIKSDRLIDAYAVVALLQKSGEDYSVVRRARFAPLFRTLLPNTKWDFYPAGENDELITIEPTEACTIAESIEIITKQLDLLCECTLDQIELISPDVNVDINFCLMLTPEEHEMPLQLIDLSINNILQKGYVGACAAHTPLPCIRGCKDYRCVINWLHIPVLVEKGVAIITNNKDIGQLAKSFDGETVILSHSNDITCANGVNVDHPITLTNIIQRTLK